MGGRSGQSVGGGGNVSAADYAEASKKDWYQSYYNGNENEKTLNAYAERGFYVNYNIRDGNLDKADNQYMKNLDKALNKLPTEKEQELYRGINTPNGTFDNIKEGGTIKFEGYTSTTKDKGVVDKFIGKNKNNDTTPTIFKIISHKNGKSIERYSSIKSEKEVVFKRNTNWKIIKKEGNEITIKQI